MKHCESGVKWQQSTDQGIRSVSLVSSASQSGSLKIIRSDALSHATDSATENTMSETTKMIRNEFGDLYEFIYRNQIIREKNHKSEKNGFLPYPQVFRNSFSKVRNKSEILSQTKTNYIWRPSVKRDYTNSFRWHSQPLPSNGHVKIAVNVVTRSLLLLWEQSYRPPSTSNLSMGNISERFWSESWQPTSKMRVCQVLLR